MNKDLDFTNPLLARKWLLALKLDDECGLSFIPNLMQDQKYEVIVSHRSGETNNTLIADLSVAINAKYIKLGAPARGERVAKYNRLLQIEEDLQSNMFNSV